MSDLSTPPARDCGFLDPRDFPWLARVRERLDDIREEVAGVIERYRYLRWRFPERYHGRSRGVSGDRATFYLEVYAMALRRNVGLCPRTADALAHVPGRATCGIYLLDAQAHILPHRGPTSLLLRAHMGVVCPSGCHLRIGSETRTWTEGGFIVFDDTREHEARNDSPDMRAILMIDFFREPLATERQVALLGELRRRMLGPRDYPWLLAADIEADDATLAEMRAAAKTDAHAASIRALVEDNGLYFA